MATHIVRLLALSALVVAALVAVSPASAAADYRYDNDLRWWVHNSLEQASYTETHGKTIPKVVEVRCYTSKLSFERGAWRRGIPIEHLQYVIAYYNGTNSVMMRNGTCKAATRFTQGIFTEETVGAFKTLLHEALHRQGFHHERNTETYAIAAMKAAGQLVQWNVYLSRGAQDEDAAWESAYPAGERAQQLAFDSSHRWIAESYLPSWDEVQAAERLGWAARLNR